MGGLAAGRSLLASEGHDELEALLGRTHLRFLPDMERAFRADYAERWR